MPILDAEPSKYPPDLLATLSQGPVDPARCWWAVYTKARQEKALARSLVQFEIPFYLPLIPKDNLIRGRRVRSHIPLFSGYVFLYGNENERGRCLTTNRISKILPVEHQEQLLHDLDNIDRLIAADAPLTLESRLQAGDPVRVKTGPMRGTDGVVITRRGKNCLLVAVNFLQQGASVEIEDFQLEPL